MSSVATVGQLRSLTMITTLLVGMPCAHAEWVSLDCADEQLAVTHVRYDPANHLVWVNGTEATDVSFGGKFVDFKVTSEQGITQQHTINLADLTMRRWDDAASKRLPLGKCAKLRNGTR